MRRYIFKDLMSGFLVLLISLGMSLWTFRESPRSLFVNKIPLAGDGLLTGLYIKIVDKSSYLSLFFQNVATTQFGWPNKLDFTSYPVGNTQEMFAIKIFMDLTGINDPSQIIHIFSILKAAPIAVTSYILARIIGINRLLSFGIGLIFSFNSFNLVRAEGHFFLALTWSLPLGFAAIYLAFKQVHSIQPLNKKILGLVTAFGLLSFMSGFYYSFFLIIFSFVSLFFLAIFRYLKETNQVTSYRVKKLATSLFLPIYVLLIFLLGLLLQTIPVLIRGKSILSLTSLADRSAVEAIIYAGTPESLLFDFYSFGLRILKRPDLVAYLQSRVSWEGSQVGALSGAIIVCIFVFILIIGTLKLLKFHAIPLKGRWELESGTTFVILTLSTSLLFYLVSPLNFGVSRILPQIRAWGRLSVVISLFTLLLLGLFLSRLKRSEIIVWPVIVLSVLIPISEIKQFQLNRPLSVALNDSAKIQNLNFQSILNKLKVIYPANCSLVNLPTYPFPEFDRPDDKNIDYGQLQIPILDEGYFRWSYGGIKATQNFAAWQPLISEFPPFARATIGEQIKYSQSLGACGVLIDRTYLNESEILDLEKILANRSPCNSELGGIMADGDSRYVSINFKSIGCKSTTEPSSIRGVGDPTNKKLLWRIDQSSDLGFVGLFQVFPIASTINLRIKSALNDNASIHVLKIKIFSGRPIKDLKLNLQLIYFKNGEVRNFQIRPDSNGLAEIQLPPILLSGKVERFSASLVSNTDQVLTRWGIQVGIKD